MNITKDDYGRLVVYYDEGTRVGYLDKILDKGKSVKIRPMLTYDGRQPHSVTVAATALIDFVEKKK